MRQSSFSCIRIGIAALLVPFALPGNSPGQAPHSASSAISRAGMSMPRGKEKKEQRKSGRAVTPESIVRISRIEVDPARISEYLVLVAECGRKSMAQESGVLLMYSMQEKRHPERIAVLEIYADRAAYEHHIKTSHFRKYKQNSLAMVRKLELIDQNPLVPEMKMK